MNIKSFAKEHKKAAIAISVIVAVVAALILGFGIFSLCSHIYSLDHDIKYDRAMAIAKKEFKLDKILWITDNPLSLSTKSDDEFNVKNPGRYEYGIVGEMNGEEVFIIVQSDTKRNKPFIATWGLDYSFTEIVEKFNELGAQYVADVPKDYYAAGIDSYIKYYPNENPSDARVVFTYSRKDGKMRYNYYVTIEDGELKTDVSASQIYF